VSPQKKHHSSGFTLIELLVAMAVGLVIMGALYSFFVTQKKMYDVQAQVAEMQQNAQAAMDVMTRELRMAGYDPVNTPKLGTIVTAAADRIRFTANVTRTDTTTTALDSPDEDVLDPGEDITYYVETLSTGTKQLVRVARERLSASSASALKTSPIAENIESVAFTYHKADGTSTAAIADIREIRITLTARTALPDPTYTDPLKNDHYRRYTLTAQVMPRNLLL
jgi:type IV pilus assembly protein PilW